ncbi:MAG: HNH endonuclease [bacterium]|nr:HNH endonuclease [bacterium]
MGSCWEWKNKYASVRLGDSIVHASLLAWFIYKRVDIPLTGQICHICNNRRCVNPAHLYNGTAKENAAYMVICKRTTGQKINKKDAEEIRESKKLGASVGSLAFKYNLSISAIYKILEGLRWQEN